VITVGDRQVIGRVLRDAELAAAMADSTDTSFTPLSWGDEEPTALSGEAMRQNLYAALRARKTEGHYG
jgi:hypothetical protein